MKNENHLEWSSWIIFGGHALGSLKGGERNLPGVQVNLTVLFLKFADLLIRTDPYQSTATTEQQMGR